MNLGSWYIDDLVTFSVNTFTSGGNPTDADSPPTYRVYEDETGTPILTGTMALLDDANTTGFYSEQITLSAANGFEKGKSYSIRILGTVGGVSGVTLRTLQVWDDIPWNADWDAEVETACGEAILAANFATESEVATAVLTAADSDPISSQLADGVTHGGGTATLTLNSTAITQASYVNFSVSGTMTVGANAIAWNTAWGTGLMAHDIGAGRTVSYFLQGGMNKIAFAADGLSYTLYSTDDLTVLDTGDATRHLANVGGLRSVTPTA